MKRRPRIDTEQLPLMFGREHLLVLVIDLLSELCVLQSERLGNGGNLRVLRFEVEQRGGDARHASVPTSCIILWNARPPAVYLLPPGGG